MNTQRCQPPASLKKLNAAPSLCSRISSSTGSSTIRSNSSKRSTTNALRPLVEHHDGDAEPQPVRRARVQREPAPLASSRLRLPREPNDPLRFALLLRGDEFAGLRACATRSRASRSSNSRGAPRAQAITAASPSTEQHDAIGDLEARLLACVLHGANELARDALAAQRVVERRVEPDEITRPPRRKRNPSAAELSTSRSAGSIASDWPSIDERLRLAARDGGGDRGAVGLRQVLADRRNQLAVALADDREVRLDAIGHERRVARDELERA